MALPTIVPGRTVPACPNLSLSPNSRRPRHPSHSIHASHHKFQDAAFRQQIRTIHQSRQNHQQWPILKAIVKELDATVSDPDLLTQEVEALAAEVTQLLDGANLYFVGMMGSGKSTVGKIVAAALGYPYLDIDAIIVETAGCTVAQIFADQGEQAFRDLESQVLQDLGARKGVVVSTGGGAVMRDQNWGHMSQGIVIWLKGAPELLTKRALSDGTQSRPLLSQSSDQGDDAYTALLAKVTGILDKRQHLYRQSDLHIPLERSPGDPSDCGATPAAVAYRVLKSLEEHLKKGAI
ncbi:hypothetical protein WJX75_003434 [Coccomyxa subellipsoidea]|uniref:shikimate kinase n=1 Tax=Coccomyxa subellipsoidea TaxID=248742 RepID=A0ABR2YM96_9CHLO